MGEIKKRLYFLHNLNNGLNAFYHDWSMVFFWLMFIFDAMLPTKLAFYFKGGMIFTPDMGAEGLEPPNLTDVNRTSFRQKQNSNGKGRDFQQDKGGYK